MPTSTKWPSDWRDRPVVTVREYAMLFGCAPQTVYSAVSRGEVPTIKVGDHYRIPVIAIRRMLGELPESDGPA